MRQQQYRMLASIIIEKRQNGGQFAKTLPYDFVRTRTSVSSAMTATSYCSPRYDISIRLPLHQPVLDELTACISDNVPERHYLPVQKHILFVTHLPRNACLFPDSCLLSSDTSEYDPAILIRRHFVMEPSLLPSCQTPHIWCC